MWLRMKWFRFVVGSTLSGMECSISEQKSRFSHISRFAVLSPLKKTPNQQNPWSLLSNISFWQKMLFKCCTFGPSPHYMLFADIAKGKMFHIILPAPSCFQGGTIHTSETGIAYVVLRRQDLSLVIYARVKSSESSSDERVLCGGRGLCVLATWNGDGELLLRSVHQLVWCLCCVA